MEYMEYEDVDIVKPLDRLFEDQIREYESGSDRVSDKDLKKMMRELGDYEIGCRTGRRRNRE
jgi:rubrerythrin